MPNPATIAEACIGNPAREVPAGQLPNRFHEAEEPGSAAGLSHRKLAAAGIDGNEPSAVKPVPADEFRAFAFGAESQIFHLNERHHRIVVIGLKKIDVRRLDAGAAVQMLAIAVPSRRASGSDRRERRYGARWSSAPSHREGPRPRRGGAA